MAKLKKQLTKRQKEMLLRAVSSKRHYARDSQYSEWGRIEKKLRKIKV